LKEPFRQFVKNKLGRGFLLITCGLPVTGKTTAAREIVRTSGYPFLQSDLIRLEVLEGEDIFSERIASDMEKRMRVYDELFKRAEEALGRDGGAILDATFVRQSLRGRAAEIAVRNNLRLIILETVCPQEVALKRIRGRTRENYESNAITEQAYFNNKKIFEPVDPDNLKTLYPGLEVTHLVVDTASDGAENWSIVHIEEI
jgi:predicted kinase